MNSHREVINHNPQRSQSTESTESEASSLDYAERMQALNHQLWADQLKEREQALTSQANVPHACNEANLPIPPPHVNGINYSVSPPDPEPSAIPYQANQPADPQLWDRNSNLISLFGTDKFLVGNTKNIVCSIQRITIFIK